MKEIPQVYDYRLNKPRIVEILKVKKERGDVVSLTFKYEPLGEGEPVPAFPGQFFMVWVPGSDEIPMSISRIGLDNTFSISVMDVGETTHLLNSVKAGDKIGIRGPYGTHFSLNRDKDSVNIIVGGGIGMAAVLPLIKEALQFYRSPDNNSLSERLFIIEGVKTKSDLLFVDEIEGELEESGLNNTAHFLITTDDGSFGIKGFPTDVIRDIVKKIDDGEKRRGESSKGPSVMIYACGPERMLKAIYDLAEEIGASVQLSLERMMRCGFGICGLCALEPTGLLVCKDGPVFRNSQLKNVEDFGKKHRTFSGKEVPI